MPRKTTATAPSAPHDLTGFRLPPVYEWVTCERDEINEGLVEPLKIQVLVNPPRAEILALAQSIEAVFAASRERMAAAKEANEPVFDPAADEESDRQLMALIAPRIVGWNVRAENTDGKLVDVWPPAEAPAAPLLLNARQRGWLLSIVQAAHLGGDTRGKLSRPRAAMDATAAERTPSGPQVVDIPTGESRPSPRKSS
jgi:hypothetical protein